MFIQIFSESKNILLQIWYGDAASWARVSCIFFNVFVVLLSSRSRSKWRLMWSKYDPFYYIFWTIDSLATKFSLPIHHLRPECPVKKKRITAFRVKVTAKGQNVNVLSRWSLLKHQTFCLQTWYCDASVCVRVSCKEIYIICYFQELMIKMWQFLLYLLNCWSFCCQTWFDSTLS